MFALSMAFWESMQSGYTHARTDDTLESAVERLDDQLRVCIRRGIHHWDAMGRSAEHVHKLIRRSRNDGGQQEVDSAVLQRCAHVCAEGLSMTVCAWETLVFPDTLRPGKGEDSGEVYGYELAALHCMEVILDALERTPEVNHTLTLHIASHVFRLAPFVFGRHIARCGALIDVHTMCIEVLAAVFSQFEGVDVREFDDALRGSNDLWSALGTALQYACRCGEERSIDHIGRILRVVEDKCPHLDRNITQVLHGGLIIDGGGGGDM